MAGELDVLVKGQEAGLEKRLLSVLLKGQATDLERRLRTEMQAGVHAGPTAAYSRTALCLLCSHLPLRGALK